MEQFSSTIEKLKEKVASLGTHILRYGLARIARKLGGIEGVMAITGHKEYKMADHYSRSYEEDNEKITKVVMEFLRSKNPSLMTSIKDPTDIEEISTEVENALLTMAEKIKTNREMPDTPGSVGKADVISLLNYKNSINRH
jgi:hypothetical protein